MFLLVDQGSFTAFCKAYFLYKTEGAQASCAVINEEQAEWLWHQIATPCQMFRVKTQGQIRTLSAKAVNDEAEWPRVLKLGYWSATKDRGRDDDCEEDVVIEYALTWESVVDFRELLPTIFGFTPLVRLVCGV